MKRIYNRVKAWKLAWNCGMICWRYMQRKMKIDKLPIKYNKLKRLINRELSSYYHWTKLYWILSSHYYLLECRGLYLKVSIGLALSSIVLDNVTSLIKNSFCRTLFNRVVLLRKLLKVYAILAMIQPIHMRVFYIILFYHHALSQYISVFRSFHSLYFLNIIKITNLL